MDLLILGGTQWLGRTLATEAVARGHRVTCLARGEAGGVADGVELVVADRSQPGAYDAVSGRDWDAVIDVTRQPGFARRAAVDLGPRAGHWTFISSGNVYAAQDQPGADESAELMPPLESDESTPDTGTQVHCGAAREAGLTRDVDHRVPVAPAHLVVRARLRPIGAHEGDAVGHLARLTPSEAGHAVSARQRPRREGASEPLRSAEDEQVHPVITARHGMPGPPVFSEREPARLGGVGLRALVRGFGNRSGLSSVVAIDTPWGYAANGRVWRRIDEHDARRHARA